MQKGLALGQILSFDPAIDTFVMSFQDQDAALVAQSGAAWARMNLRVDRYPRWDADLLTRYISTVDLLKSANPSIQVIGLLAHELVPGASQARWNRNNTEYYPDGDPVNFFIEEYLGAVDALLGLRDDAGRAITDYITHWEVWNEPNAWTQHNPATLQPGADGTLPLPGGTFIFPSLLATLLREAAARIHAAQPGSTVLAGGILAHDADNGIAYLASVYDRLAGAPPPFDAVAMHYYLSPGTALNTGTLTSYLKALQTFLAAREGAGVRRPIYITEAGWSTPPLSPQTQAQNLTAFFRTCGAALTQPPATPIPAACWYTLYDTPPPAPDPGRGDHWFGLYTRRFQPKPAFAAFQGLP